MTDYGLINTILFYSILPIVECINKTKSIFQLSLKTNIKDNLFAFHSARLYTVYVPTVYYNLL